jgi:cytoskeletal protein RodZ
MAAARETEEAVSSGGETTSADEIGHKTDPGARSPDEIVAGNRAKPAGEFNSTTGSKLGGTGSAPSSSTETPKAGADGEPSLGKMLAAVREQRGVSRAEVVLQTRIPAHYLDMIESSDYGLISDQLYLMPFLRRYAAFLNLEGEEIAMRFVREVQRAEGAAVPRMSEPLAVHDNKRAPWGRVAVVTIVLCAIVVLYIIASRHHSGEFGSHPPASSVAPEAPSAAIPPAEIAPAPPAAPAQVAAPPPQAAAPAPPPDTTVRGASTAPAVARPQKAPSSRTAAPSGQRHQ